MSEINSISSDTSSTTPVTDTQSTGATGASGEGGGSTIFKSMADFKNQYPTVYEKMMQGAATTIVNQMKASQDRIVEINRKARQANGG